MFPRKAMLSILPIITIIQGNQPYIFKGLLCKPIRPKEYSYNFILYNRDLERPDLPTLDNSEAMKDANPVGVQTWKAWLSIVKLYIM